MEKDIKLNFDSTENEQKKDSKEKIVNLNASPNCSMCFGKGIIWINDKRSLCYCVTDGKDFVERFNLKKEFEK